MMTYKAGTFDIAVIGAGHAGIEAALACARMGVKVVCFTLNMDAVGNMPCNPSIGGTAKGCLVREIDALGGEMAKAADETCIQFRMLNRGKGPAVRSPRAQADRQAYMARMRRALETEPRVTLKQAEITDILISGSAVSGVKTALGAEYEVKAVVLALGTYLNARIIVGDVSRESGPDGLMASGPLSRSLLNIGVELRRFKTGTPPRIAARSADLSKMEPQYGETDLSPFSFSTEKLPENQIVCYLTYTNQNTHDIIRQNLERSPLFSGGISGVGTRYCPSIEDKVVRFADKSRHPVFVEPMGILSGEMYLQGLSSSLPEDVQIELVRTIPGLENAEFTRPAYAIEYECMDPSELTPTLEHRKISGLYGVGQFIGTSGYEEAAALGLIAGINSALKILEKQQIVLSRSDAIIGALIDDLVYKGTNEPYRMMTSRSEYRLITRQDNADGRLTKIGFSVGLVPRERLLEVELKYELVRSEITRLKKVNIRPSDELNYLLKRRGTTPLTGSICLYELLKRPQLTYDDLAPFDSERPELSAEVCEQVDIEVRYEGYLRRQEIQAKELLRMEERLMPPDIDYGEVEGLRIEAREKLNRVRPISVGHASRISGVNPADVVVLLLYLEKKRRERGVPNEGTSASGA